MHWFDRLSRQLAAAPQAQTTRRGVLKSAGAAAVAAPLASHATAYAKNVIKAQQASLSCTKCLANAYQFYVEGIEICYQQHTAAKNAAASTRVAAVTKGKQGRKTTPGQSAKLLHCLAHVRSEALPDVIACRTGPPCVPPPPPLPPAGSGSICAPGTTSCPGGGVTVICCYGGDACCPCGTVTGGWICCAGVIGCSCC